MESTTMELKLMYCKDLQAFNFFQKLNVYALISITAPQQHQQYQQQHRTPTDKENDANPEWNHEVKLKLPDNNYEDVFIEFDLKHEGQFFGDKTIGIVKVPLKDLFEEQTFGISRFVNYQVSSPEDGKPNGILNFCYKVDKKIADSGTILPNISGFSMVSHEDHQFNGVHYPDLSFFSEPHYSQDNFYPPVNVYPPPQPATTSTVYPPMPLGHEVAQVVSHHHYGPSDGHGYGMYGDGASGYGYDYGANGEPYGSNYWR